MPSRLATGSSAWHWVIIIAKALAMKTIKTTRYKPRLRHGSSSLCRVSCRYRTTNFISFIRGAAELPSLLNSRRLAIGTACPDQVLISRARMYGPGLAHMNRDKTKVVKDNGTTPSITQGSTNRALPVDGNASLCSAGVQGCCTVLGRNKRLIA